MNISNNINSNIILNGDLDQTFLGSKSIMSAQCDFPNITFWQRLPVLEPLDHATNEFQANFILSLLVRQLGTNVRLV